MSWQDVHTTYSVIPAQCVAPAPSRRDCRALSFPELGAHLAWYNFACAMVIAIRIIETLIAILSSADL